MLLEKFPKADFRLGFTSGMDVFSQILQYKGINHNSSDILYHLNTKSSSNVNLIKVANGLTKNNIPFNIYMDLTHKLVKNNSILNVFDVLDIIISNIDYDEQNQYVQSLLYLNRKTNIEFRNINLELIKHYLNQNKPVIVSLHANSFLGDKYPDFHEKIYTIIGIEGDSFVFRDKKDFKIPIDLTLNSIKNTKNPSIMVV
jgi:hypothetical protein